MQAIEIQPVERPQQIQQVAALAKEIWTQHYADIISLRQIEYMVDRFQSVAAIEEQLRDQGYRYFLLRSSGQSIGYMGIQQQPQDCMFLSKIYLQQKYRGNGYAAQAIQYLEKICCLEQLHTIWLTVNKGNADSIAAYKHMGFAIARTQVADIGQGFVMDDYIMEKSLD